MVKTTASSARLVFGWFLIALFIIIISEIVISDKYCLNTVVL